MSAGKQRGFTLPGALLLAAMMGLGVVAYGEFASHAAQREKEAELLFRGAQYRQAIESYYRKDRTYPRALSDLIEDKRYPMPVRHLRKLYRDPITGTEQWRAIQAPEGGIMGVHSASEAAPVKTGAFSRANAAFADAKSYSDWKFFYRPQEPNAQR